MKTALAIAENIAKENGTVDGAYKDFITLKTIVDAQNRVTPWLVEDLKDKQVFVFGSNKQGQHNGRASKLAHKRYGAVYGCCEGLFRREGTEKYSYAFPTVSYDEGTTPIPLPKAEISRSVEELEKVIKQNPKLEFLITPVGCGYGQRKPSEIAPLFSRLTIYKNVCLPRVFLNVIFGKSVDDPTTMVPYQSEGVKTFSALVEERLALYINWFQENKDNLFYRKENGLHVQDMIDKISNAMVVAVNQYFRGLPAEAYKEISKLFGLTDLLDQLKTLEVFEKPENSEFFEQIKKEIDKRQERTLKIENLVSDVEKSVFFRMRVEKDNWLRKNIDHTGMSHIPFSLRGIVKTQRYSVPGYPCLYLGEHIRGCWEELGRANMCDSLVSKVQARRSFKCLDLSMPPKERWQEAIDTVTDSEAQARHDDEIGKTAMLFPFVIACSFRTLDNKADFKPEYIVPQLMLQYVKDSAYATNKWKKNSRDEKTVYGIKYTSVHFEGHKTEGCKAEDYDLYANYVIPVLDIEDEYCRTLSDIFDITDPIWLENERIANVGGTDSFFRQVEDSLISMA